MEYFKDIPTCIQQPHCYFSKKIRENTQYVA